MKKDATAGGRLIHAHAVCPGTVATPFWNRIPERPNDPTSLTADEVACLSVELIKNPSATVADLALIKPRKEVVIKPHAPFERYPQRSRHRARESSVKGGGC